MGAWLDGNNTVASFTEAIDPAGTFSLVTAKWPKAVPRLAAHAGVCEVGGVGRWAFVAGLFGDGLCRLGGRRPVDPIRVADVIRPRQFLAKFPWPPLCADADVGGVVS